MANAAVDCPVRILATEFVAISRGIGMCFALTFGIAVETPALRFFLSRQRLPTQAEWSQSGGNRL